ncbi:hypothetical protein EVAR_68237_1 [Eumeta japonica]|uniref:Uncharacterized protein n=1 Tax=Eumeta variegata TaxID=151549 RepID=A0A4C1ZSK9_EUMVA|nr:hypothetical protein EVAR_68237_1 [Eumeta japonica]
MLQMFVAGADNSAELVQRWLQRRESGDSDIAGRSLSENRFRSSSTLTVKAHTVSSGRHGLSCYGFETSNASYSSYLRCEAALRRHFNVSRACLSAGSSSGSPGARAGRRSSLALTPEDEPLLDLAVSTASTSAPAPVAGSHRSYFFLFWMFLSKTKQRRVSNMRIVIDYETC